MRAGEVPGNRGSPENKGPALGALTPLLSSAWFSPSGMQHKRQYLSGLPAERADAFRS